MTRRSCCVYCGFPVSNTFATTRGGKITFFINGLSLPKALSRCQNVTVFRCGSGKDMVPPACSSIEGVFVFVLSPDEQQVLLVWEYGHWKVPALPLRVRATNSNHEFHPACQRRRRIGRIGDRHWHQGDNGRGANKICSQFILSNP